MQGLVLEGHSSLLSSETTHPLGLPELHSFVLHSGQSLFLSKHRPHLQVFQIMLSVLIQINCPQTLKSCVKMQVLQLCGKQALLTPHFAKVVCKKQFAWGCSEFGGLFFSLIHEKLLITLVSSPEIKRTTF